MRVRTTTTTGDDKVEMEKVYAIQILPTRANEQLALLNLNHPLPPHLTHVKRIWRSQDNVLKVLLSPVNDVLSLEDWTKIKQKFIAPTEGDILIEKVPQRMPLTREEYQQWRDEEYWPTTFHEHKALLKLEEEEQHLVERIGREVMPKILESKGPLVIIVDPKRESDWISEFGIAQMNILDEPVMSAIKQIAKGQRDADITDRKRIDTPYLCTRCLVFCRDEPSIISAMALVHSRVRAVIFAHLDPERGGVFSGLRLQDVKGINHHFSVFQVTD